MSDNKPVAQETSRADRRQEKELAAARQSGQVAPAVDSATGQMINPHNPEFITKRPWYLGGDAGGGGQAGGGNANDMSLQHQTVQKSDQEPKELSLSKAEELLQKQRQKQKQRSKSGTFVKGQWVEALKKNKQPYRMCQVLKVYNKQSRVDLKYEDGTIETRVPTSNNSSKRPRVRMTNTGNRAALLEEAPEKETLQETYASKRDAYHGYDRDAHNKKVVQKHEQKLDIRRKMREQEQQLLAANKDPAAAAAGDTTQNPASRHSDSDAADSDDDSDLEDNNGNDSTDDEFVQKDEDAKIITTRLARQGGVGGAQMKVTARNLRIREDTAKYLRNLDPNSAYYDPKSRSMRDNPNPAAQEETDFAGDNFARISGDAIQLAQQQMFAWEATERGVQEVHPQANPSQAELLKKQFQSKSQDLKKQRQQMVLQKYGGEEYLDGGDGLANSNTGATTTNDDGDQKQKATETAEERKLRFGVSTQAQEYSRDGRRVTGDDTKQSKKRVALVSKYEENVYRNGHSTVWGSYFHMGAFAWGYADDHSLMKLSYCTGEKGRIANDEANEQTYGTGQAGSAALAQARGLLTKPTTTKDGSRGAPPSTMNRSKLYGEADPNAQLDVTKVQEARLAAKKQEEEDDTDAKKRKYHSINADVEKTEEMMEAYRLEKDQKSDPMAKIDSDKLLDYK